MFVDPATPAKTVFEEAAPFLRVIGALAVAGLSPFLTWLLLKLDRHDKRKRIMEVAERRLSFWKAKSETLRLYCAEDDLTEVVRAAVARIEQEANQDLAELVWIEALNRRYAWPKRTLLLYGPERTNEHFRQYRTAYWLISGCYIIGALVFIALNLKYPLPEHQPDRYFHIIGFFVLGSPLLLLALLGNHARAAANKAIRPKPPLYDSI